MGRSKDQNDSNWRSDIVRHSGVYFLTSIAGRLASFVLLPVYASHLSPSDYGTIALLDLFTQFVAVFVVSAVSQGASRCHFDSENPDYHHTVWWTALCMLFAGMSLTVLAALLFGRPMAPVLLGNTPKGAYFLLIASTGMAFETVVLLLSTHLRVQKRSSMFSACMLLRMVLNLSLNIYFVVFANMKVEGVLFGQLIANAVTVSILLIVFIFECGFIKFDFDVARRLWAFGAPLIVTGAVAIILQQSDRYFLKCFSDMDQVGVYSMAHKISHSFTTVILLPFTMIWNVVAYEHANNSNADDIYAEVFRFFTTGMVVFLSGVAVVASPLIHIVGKPEYSDVANLVPILCIGCFFSSIATFFTLPARLEKKTLHLLPASVIGAVFCVVANLVVVPRFGATGAAWVSVGTFAIFAVANHFICRLVRPIPFPLVAPFGLGAACVAASLFYRPMASVVSSFWLFNCIWFSIWLIVAGMVLKAPLCWLIQFVRRGVKSP